MEGKYKVTFEFAETFAEDTNYVYHDRKFDWGIEQVKVLTNTPDLIILQHLLVVNDTMVIKHWRQDWSFEPEYIMEFQANNEWKKRTLSAKDNKGKWAQKVSQVDDSPRYEGIGTWVHVDGRHFWEASAYSPLPRREATARRDYNIMRRFSHMEITNNGFFLEQDNAKILKTADNEQLICFEKGMETFIKGDYDCTAAEEYWVRTEEFWSIVRSEWSAIYQAKEQIKMERTVDDVMLFAALFKMASEQVKGEKMNKEETRSTIKKTLQAYIIA
jgi:hypothetical protein